MDTVDAATRSRIMRAIRRERPAYIFASRAKNRLPGRPDFLVHHAWTGLRLAVFVHGCFWHLCRRHYKAPASDGWRRKMDANRRRDMRVRRQLRALGWRTMVVWEHERPDLAAARVLRRMDRAR
jgi:DNA mismatch endonuclease (patch repair protein)